MARRAGTSAANTVRSVPSSSETITVRVASTVPELGRSTSSALNSASIAGAKAIPASSPSTEAKIPITSASRTTEATICRRLAPTVRSIANSRVRCATVIEKVLKIRNEATKSATPAKIRSAVFRKPMNSPTSSRWESTFSSPVSACTEGGRDSERPAASCSGVTPSSAATLIWSSSPCLPVIRWASGRVITATLAPPNESTSPSVAIPTRVYWRAAALPATSIRSPISKPSASAVCLSITTSPSPAGLPPST